MPYIEPTQEAIPFLMLLSLAFAGPAITVRIDPKFYCLIPENKNRFVFCICLCIKCEKKKNKKKMNSNPWIEKVLSLGYITY